MSFALLTPEIVEAIHDVVLNPGERAGRARNKSLEGALARVDNRLAYGLINDAFDLAAAYAVAIAHPGSMRAQVAALEARVAVVEAKSR